MDGSFAEGFNLAGEAGASFIFDEGVPADGHDGDRHEQLFRRGADAPSASA